jgi:excisionase family DNA binding protein
VSREFPAKPVSIREAADHLSVSKDTIRRRIASGELTAFRAGPKLIRVDLDAAEQLFKVIPTVAGE